ncbi:DUF2628 domain-containing protein [Paraburkholderia caribensis]|uniref:DUF2628 domain-containing protein n=1 Tax=Paraburkholderia caribensis TaxID=75105 RepID=UPI00078BEDF3|nr:DUF2628 domain-containing protein [Paraburkholderia caribensis]AMV41750.1 hypothetical protein ATN79_03505 [Paraburkholderia caribensis]
MRHAIARGAPFCAGCGAEVTAITTPSLATEQGTLRSSFDPMLPKTFDGFNRLPEKWRQRFAAIDKAGGERVRWWRWPNAKELTAKEKRLITANLWGFVFGPFYYLYLGLWRKAITLSLLALAIDLILGIVGDALNLSVDRFLWIVSAVIFKQCANVDYYRKTILKRREWW